jgi:hypothetical protein
VPRSAEAARDEAVERVAQPAGVPSWVNRVLAVVRLFDRGRSFTADDLWMILGPDRPAEPRALGAALVAARQEGLARPTGQYRKSERVNRHAGPVAIWTRL